MEPPLSLSQQYVVHLLYRRPATTIKRPLRFIEESDVEDSSSEQSTYPTDEESSGDSHPAVVPAMVTTCHHKGEGDALVPSHQSPTTNLTPQAVEIQLPSVQSRDGVFANFAKVLLSKEKENVLLMTALHRGAAVSPRDDKELNAILDYKRNKCGPWKRLLAHTLVRGRQHVGRWCKLSNLRCVSIQHIGG
ncbi:hypothetical protein ILYODFUR_006466 [Ilyodon furcidens]|uniref:Uncharacterized protein n=1 Tax=Ilyodon furcidens TaxID=33524 RepID=A0ABV0UFN4_9TELE